MTLTFCSLCPDDDHRWAQHDPKGTKLATHQQLRHGVAAPLPAPVEPLPQLPKVAFQQEFIKAVREMPVGREFTTADLHGVIGDPPHPNCWGPATTAAAHLGLIEAVEMQKSELATTKGSLLRRWVRIESSRRAS